MFSRLQHTLGKAITCTGIGLHSGEDVSLTLAPAPVGHGIVFVRSDVDASHNRIRADYAQVRQTRLGTVLANAADVQVSTVEHLMAALWGCGIDNVLVTVSGPEIPIMDGSAEPFIFLIECAEVVEQAAPRAYLRIRKPVEISEGEGWIRLEPSSGFSVDLTIHFSNPAIGTQQQYFDFSEVSFKNTVSRARTFGFADDVTTLQAQGLARGGSLDNAIVLSEDKVLNRNGLRYQDEFVRHKLLDLIGDLYLAGAPIMGAVSGYRSGHGINNRLLHALFKDPSAWEYVTLADTSSVISSSASRPVSAESASMVAAAL